MLELVNVSKIYKNKSEKVYALKNCSLSIKEHQFIIITGKSGSGKTTLINLIGSLDTPSSGDILYNGQSIFKNSQEYRNQAIGFIFQEHNLIEHLNVKENIRLSLELQGQTVSDDEIIEILKKVSLEDYIDKYPNQLSTGQHQRCAIARALIKSSKIIIADEPTGSLDEKTGNQIMELLKELSKEYLVIMVTHNINYPKKYADRHIKIEKGMIIKDEIINLNTKLIKDINSIKNSNSKLMFYSKINYFKQYFKTNIKHLLRTILILSLTMFLMFLFYTFININKSKMIYNTITSNKFNNGYYINNNFVIDNDNYYEEANTGFFTQDIEKMKKKYNKQMIYPIYRKNFISLEEYLNTPSDLIYAGNISGLVEVDNTFLNYFNFILIEGNLPKAFNEEQVEIAISKFLYEFLKKYSFDNTNIIGKVIEYHNVKYKITGVIDTNLNFKDYFLKYNSQINKNKKEQYKKLIETEIHTAFFVPINYFESILVDHNTLKISGYEKIIICEKELSNNVIYVTKYINNSNIIFYEDNIISLNNNEVIVDITLLNTNQINIKINNLINEFAKNHYDEISEDFEKKYPGSNYLTYANYITSHEINEYHPDKSYLSFVSLILKEEIAELNRKVQILEIISLKGNFEEKIKIVGISLNDKDKIVLSNDYFNKVKNISYGYYDSILVKVSDKYHNDKAIINDFLNNRNIDNSILNTYYAFLPIYNSFQPFIKILFSFFTLITFILMLYFINDLLKSAKTDIGLLLALGSRKKDIKNIYFMSLSITLLISLLLSILFFLILSPFINLFLSNEYSLYTDVLFFDYKILIHYVALIVIVFLIIVNILFIKILRSKSPKSLFTKN